MHDFRVHSYYTQPPMEPSTRTISVTGQGTLYVKPDTVIPKFDSFETILGKWK